MIEKIKRDYPILILASVFMTLLPTMWDKINIYNEIHDSNI